MFAQGKKWLGGSPLAREAVPGAKRARRSAPCLELSAKWSTRFPAEAGVSLESFCTAWGVQPASESSRSRVVYCQPADCSDAFFLKLYSYRDSPAGGWLRRHKARREASNLEFLRSLGFNVPEVVALGHSAAGTFWRARQELIATEAVPRAVSLSEFGPKLKGDDPRRRDLITVLATQVKRMHEARFFHRDLKWRNLLVAPDSKGRLVFWWIDCPSGSHLSLNWRIEHARIKDLATLTKQALQYCSLRERMLFVRAYLGPRSASAERRKLADDVSSYFIRRWRG